MISQIYQIDQIPSMLCRIWKGIRSRIFLVVILLIMLYFNAFHNTTIEIFYGLLLLIICFSLFQKEDRQLVSVCFNEDENKLIIQYFQFCRTYTVEIPVEFLNYTYRPEQYGRGSAGMTLSFYNNDKLVGRIMEKFGYGWTKERVLEMKQRLALIKNPSHKKYYNGKLH